MKIQSIKIKDSKTILNSFEWSSDKPINIFIGENGSGKSTLLRHLVDVFKNAYEFYVEGNKNTTTPDFDFEIKYEIIINNTVDFLVFETNYVIVELTGKKKRKEYWDLSINNNEIDSNALTERYGYESLLPNNLIAYYAGWDSSVKNKFLEVEKRYIENALGNYKGFKSSKNLDTPFSTIAKLPLIYIDKIHFSILLSVLFSYEYNTRVESYLLNKFEIVKEEKTVVVLNVDKPAEDFFSNSKEDFWGAKGEMRNFLVNLRDFCSNREDINDEHGGLVFIFDFEDWIRFKEYYATESRLYSYLHILNSSGFLTSIQVFFNKNGKPMSNFNLSEGEQQQLTVFALKEILIETNSLILLDEPETFLHPRWQKKFINELAENINYNRNVDFPYHNEPNFFITTHSLNLLNNADSDVSSLTMLENGKVSQKVKDFYGKTIRSINYDLMGLEERPEDIKLIINNLYDLVENEEMQKAENELGLLIDIVGENDEDVVRLKAEIDFLKSLTNDTDQ